jgi:circadian clock protein KaiC
MKGRELISTGIERLDEVLCGGLPARRLYLIQGDPGVGKTTLGLQFLLEGHRRGEKTLYITLSETRDELRSVASSHGWDISDVPLFELDSGGDVLLEDQNTLFQPSEVELAEMTRSLLAEVERVKPVRLVFDSLSEMRLLAQSALRYRRQLLALKQHLAARGCTVLLMDDRTSEAGDLQVQSLAHGVIALEQLSPLYGSERRRLRVVKLRGVSFRGGYHDYRIKRGGLDIYPRLVAAEHPGQFRAETVPSGAPSLDALLGDGLDRGTSALFLGPAGSGKSALTMQFAHAAVQRGEAVRVFAFDEGLATIEARGRALGTYVESDLLHVRQVDPAEMSPGEFVHQVRQDVEDGNARVVIIDSLNGYLAAMPEEQFLVIQLHELLSYLRQRGVLTIMTVAQQGLIGTMSSPVDVSYLADTVIMLRFFEARGVVRKAISVLKRRSGAHATDIRELIMKPRISVGEQLSDLQGVFTGVPRFEQERERA